MFCLSRGCSGDRYFSPYTSVRLGSMAEAFGMEVCPTDRFSFFWWVCRSGRDSLQECVRPPSVGFKLSRRLCRFNPVRLLRHTDGPLNRECCREPKSRSTTSDGVSSAEPVYVCFHPAFSRPNRTGGCLAVFHCTPFLCRTPSGFFSRTTSFACCWCVS